MTQGAGFWGDVVAGAGSLLGGIGGESDSDSYQRKLDRVRRIEAAYVANDQATLRKFKNQWPKLMREIARGEWRHVAPSASPALQARPGSPGTRPFVTRPGDMALRVNTSALPAIGAPLRRVAGTALRVAAPATWGLFAASFVPPSWVTTGAAAARTVLARLPNTAPMAPGLPGGRAPVGRATGIGRPPEIPPAAPRRTTAPAPPPAGANRGIARPELQPVVVTARRYSKPTGAVTQTVARELKWWEKAIGLLAKVPPGQIAQLLTRARSTAPRVNVGPFTFAPERPVGVPEPSAPPLTPLEPGGADCACPPKKPRAPRKPRSECRSGRFIERRSGIQKYQTRKIPCRAFNAKLS